MRSIALIANPLIELKINSHLQNLSPGQIDQAENGGRVPPRGSNSK